MNKFLSFFVEEDLPQLTRLLRIDLNDFMKKRIVLGFFFLLLIIPCVFLKLNWGILFCVILAFLGFKYKYFKLKKMKKYKIQQVKIAFPLWLSTVEALLISETIPTAITKSLNVCPDILKDDLEELSATIILNPLDKDAYMKCFSKWSINDISETMMDFWRFNSLQQKEIIYEFSALQNRLSSLQSEARSYKYEVSLSYGMYLSYFEMGIVLGFIAIFSALTCLVLF